jgi:cell division protein FtsI/penicillin-binding protein 2
VGILCGAGVLMSSLYMTQVTYGGSYQAKANQQYVHPAVALFDRGTIYFETKDGTRAAAATVASGYLVYMNPSLVTDAEQVFQSISQYLPLLDHAHFVAQAAKVNDHYEVVADKVDAGPATSLANLALKGVSVVKETWREYPGGSLGAHELGLVGENGTSSVEGRYGLESSYQPILDRSSLASSQNVFAELFSNSRPTGASGTASQAGDIVTTIEPTVEQYLEKVLSNTAATWHPDEIGGIIIDPKTGEIAAMSSLPTFNANDLSSAKNSSVFSNPMVENVYEMGSIMKPLTMATALDSGAEFPDSTYDDTGTMTLSGRKISNFDGVARGVIPMQQILSQSLNVGAATIALQVGKQDFSKYFLSFGLGQKTGIDEPNEATGIVNNLRTGRDIEIATAAYGQGIAISPVAMARALSILANGGYLVRPHLVKEIDYTDGTNQPIVPPPVGPLLKPQTVTDVTKMLVEVVDSALAHGAIKMDHYSVAAKTGTAQIPDHANGGYYTDRYLHSFFGYFPAYNPRFLIFLYQVYPKGAEYASATLTEPFSQITKFLIDYYNIPPDR